MKIAVEPACAASTAALLWPLREQLRGKHVVLACYNMAIPYLCPELPSTQREALSSLVKVPLVFTNVLLRSWRAFEQLGVGVAHCPGSFHSF